MVVLVGLAALPEVQAQETSQLLTQAADILSLPAKQAGRHLPVFVRGIVTAVEPQWNGQFFVQDATGGVFVENLSDRPPEPGDVVEITGVSHAGAFAPIIGQPNWKKVGTAPLPEGKVVPIEQLMSGCEDSQRVVVYGIVRTAQISSNKSNLDLEIASAGYRLHAFPKIPGALEPQRLVGARVRLQGTAAAAFYPGLKRRLVAVNIFMPLPGDFVVETTDSIDPFTKPSLGLSDIGRYRRDNRPDQRVHVKGVITYLRPGEGFFLKDKSGGLRVKSRQVEALSVGDVVESAGFADIENFLPVLEDAVFHKTAETRPDPKPKPVTLPQVLDGVCHADLVTIQGKLLDRFVRSDPQPASGKMRMRTVLIMQSEDLTFTAETEAPEALQDLAPLPLGGTIEVSGVCLTESGEDGKTRSFQILMPTGKGVRVLARPSWLTPQRLLTGLGLVLGASVVGVGWTIMVAKKNSILQSLVRAKETAQRELQQAHDQLEERVKERTAQLKVEMTIRKESELQFRAVLAERTRLAQELHDTVEQTMTGIALQLDLVTDQFEKTPDSASHHLKIARSLMRRSQVDLRRSVWGLRSRAEEKFNLANALLTSGREITGDTGINIEVATDGEVNPLSEIVEENLLRIGQEVVTNVVKHSDAVLVKIELQYSPQNIVLQIKDDGKGFDPQACAGPKDGHFGLLGIRERTERLGGQVLITSAPGKGASVRVEIPTDSSNADWPLPTSIEAHEERV
jgi:signal transduction histidine kinase